MYYVLCTLHSALQLKARLYAIYAAHYCKGLATKRDLVGADGEKPWLP